MTVTPEFGILFLGIFVGAILGFGLAKAGGNLKAALTVLGASLGGGPILFIDEVAAARWMYPVGLVIGLAWLRILAVRVWLEGRAENPGMIVRRGTKVTGLRTEAGPEGIRHVTGVRTADGGLRADLVVDAMGRDPRPSTGSSRPGLGLRRRIPSSARSPTTHGTSPAPSSLGRSRPRCPPLGPS